MALNMIVSIPRVFAGILLAFLLLIGLRVTWPIADYILSLSWGWPIMKVSAVLGMWLIILFLTWFFIWVQIFSPIEKELPNQGRVKI